MLQAIASTLRRLHHFSGAPAPHLRLYPRQAPRSTLHLQLARLSSHLANPRKQRRFLELRQTAQLKLPHHLVRLSRQSLKHWHLSLCSAQAFLAARLEILLSLLRAVTLSQDQHSPNRPHLLFHLLLVLQLLNRQLLRTQRLHPSRHSSVLLPHLYQQLKHVNLCLVVQATLRSLLLNHPRTRKRRTRPLFRLAPIQALRLLHLLLLPSQPHFRLASHRRRPLLLRPSLSVSLEGEMLLLMYLANRSSHLANPIQHLLIAL